MTPGIIFRDIPRHAPAYHLMNPECLRVAFSMIASHPSPDSSNEVCAACARDQNCVACFEALIARLQVPLLHHLMHRTGSREDAEDLLQETILAGYRNIKMYDSSWRFSTWIFAIAHNLAVSAARKQRWKIVGAVDLVDEIASSTSAPLAAAARSEMSDSLWIKARGILEADAFTAVWLTYVEGMAAAEVAVVIGKTANAVRIMLSRSRARLADQLPASWRPERTVL